MKSTTVYLTIDQRKEIKRLARELGTPQALIIRQGVEMGIAWAQERESRLRAPRQGKGAGR